MDRVIDCNYCSYLSISETRQNALKKQGEIRLHICLKFNKRVFHYTNTKDHAPYLCPCAECVAEMNKKDGESDG